MIVRECNDRQCCEPQDLHPLADSIRRGNAWDFVSCKYCGKEYEYVPYTDAAGSTDWNYEPTKGHHLHVESTKGKKAR